MIKSKKYKKVGIEIDLTGPDGNAFAILGLAKRLCREFDIPVSYTHLTLPTNREV